MAMKKENLLKFLPNEYIKSISDINYDNLKNQGYDTIFFDLDNTIADYETHHPTEEMINLIENIKTVGFKIYIITNNTKKRIDKFQKAFNIDCFKSLRKPFTRRLRNKIIENNIDTTKVIWIGDQVVTDVKCAHKFNIYCVLIDPLKPSTEKWYTKINRFFERRYMKKIKREYQKEYDQLGLDKRYASN